MISAFPRTVFTLSRQSDILFSMRPLLRNVRDKRSKVLACINGSTCVRHVTDMFSTPVFGPLTGKGQGDHFMSFCGREISLLWEALHERVAQNDNIMLSGDTVCVYHPQDCANMQSIDRSNLIVDVARAFGVMRRMEMDSFPLFFYRHGRVGGLPCEAPLWASVNDLCKHLFRMKLEK
ncbi:hypothetical protein EBZ80_13220 [bacterium]|nr:hypothetical protein [bacterium]